MQLISHWFLLLVSLNFNWSTFWKGSLLRVEFKTEDTVKQRPKSHFRIQDDFRTRTKECFQAQRTVGIWAQNEDGLRVLICSPSRSFPGCSRQLVGLLNLKFFNRKAGLPQESCFHLETNDFVFWGGWPSPSVNPCLGLVFWGIRFWFSPMLATLGENKTSRPCNEKNWMQLPSSPL